MSSSRNSGRGLAVKPQDTPAVTFGAASAGSPSKAVHTTHHNTPSLITAAKFTFGAVDTGSAKRQLSRAHSPDITTVCSVSTIEIGTQTVRYCNTRSSQTSTKSSTYIPYRSTRSIATQWSPQKQAFVDKSLSSSATVANSSDSLNQPKVLTRTQKRRKSYRKNKALRQLKDHLEGKPKAEALKKLKQSKDRYKRKVQDLVKEAKKLAKDSQTNLASLPSSTHSQSKNPISEAIDKAKNFAKKYLKYKSAFAKESSGRMFDDNKEPTPQEVNDFVHKFL